MISLPTLIVMALIFALVVVLFDVLPITPKARQILSAVLFIASILWLLSLITGGIRLT